MPKPETAAKRFATHVIRSGEIYKGARADAKAFCESAGIDFAEIEEKVSKNLPSDEPEKDDDDGDGDSDA